VKRKIDRVRFPRTGPRQASGRRTCSSPEDGSWRKALVGPSAWMITRCQCYCRYRYRCRRRRSCCAPAVLVLLLLLLLLLLRCSPSVCHVQCTAGCFCWTACTSTGKRKVKDMWDEWSLVGKLCSPRSRTRVVKG